MKENIRVIILALFAITLCFPLFRVPTYAQVPNDEAKIGDRVILSNGEEAVYHGREGSKFRYMAIIDAPTYVPGTTTEIKPNWAYSYNDTEWYAEDNLFEAIVKNGKVTVTRDGQTLSWDPTVLVGTKSTKSLTKEPTLLAVDPQNYNYLGNTLEWIFPGCKRHLRIIEGVLLEYFIFDEDPGDSVQIKSNLVKDANFVWDSAAFAYDANYKPIGISQDKTVSASEFSREDITYPVTIDPTTTYTTSASDGHLYRDDPNVYATAHDAAAADTVSSSGTTFAIGQYYAAVGDFYALYRGTGFFDTSGLPDNSEIDSAVLKLYGNNDFSDTDFNIQIQNGQPTYPSDPMVAGDYLYTQYSGNGGTLSTSGWTTGGYNSITLSATGEGWISKTGITKLALLSDEDVGDSTPTGNEYVLAWAYEKGDGFRPQLEITYTASVAPTVTTVAASDISTTTANLRGYLDSDGGEECEIQFEYDVDSGTPYALNTSWLATNYTTGQSPSDVVEGLNVDDTYYFRVQARNSVGTINGTELSFATLASLNPPTNFVAIPRAISEVSLRWTKGIGASQTLVRYKVGEYPGSTTDGTLACNITGGSYLVEDLSPGVSYYFKTWGYDAGSFSSTNATEIATTLGGEVPGDGFLPDPDPPSGYFADPDTTALQNLPFYDNFNSIADTIDMPRTSFWLTMGMALSIVLGASFYMVTRNPTFALLGVGLGIMGGWNAGVFPAWILIVFVILAGSLIWLFKGGEQRA